MIRFRGQNVKGQGQKSTVHINLYGEGILPAYLFTITFPLHLLPVGEVSIGMYGPVTPVIPILIIFRPKLDFESKSIPATVGEQSARCIVGVAAKPAGKASRDVTCPQVECNCVD